MKLEVKFDGARARTQASAPLPFGPAFEAAIVERTETLEVHGTCLLDPCDDFCEFRTKDAGGTLLACKKVGRY